MPPIRTVLRGIPTGLVCAVLALLVGATPLGRALDDWFSDACFILRGPRDTTAKIVIIAIDDASLEELGKPAAFLSPELARIVRFAAREGAVAIGLDYFIPSYLSNLKEIDQPSVGDAPDGEGRKLADAADKTGRLVLPIVLAAGAGDPFRKPLEQWQGPTERLDNPTPYGFLNLTTDPDLFIRRQRLLADPSSADETLPRCFALALYARSRQARVTVEGGFVRVADRKVPVDARGRMRINFVGPAGTPGHSTFPMISLREALAAERAGRAVPVLSGAIAIIALGGPGEQDIHPTPYSNGAARLFSTTATTPLTPGPEVHAHVIATIHDKLYLTRPLALEPPLWALAAGVALGATFARVGLLRGAAALTAFLIALGALALALFLVRGLLFNPVPVALTAQATYTAVLARRWWQLRRSFAVLKSDAVLRALEAEPQRLDPGGETREITALFVDIRDFTPFSARHKTEPKVVVELLNAYYTVVIPTLEDEGGTIIAFMGDGLMVLFGAPAKQDDHAARAVSAAIALAQAVAANAGLWTEKQFAGLKVGVGVHTGQAAVGAIGSGDRKDYTAVGDTVNTASRVEGKTKDCPATVLITAATFAKLANAPALADRGAARKAGCRRSFENPRNAPALAARCQALPEPVTLKGLGLVHLYQVT